MPFKLSIHLSFYMALWFIAPCKINFLADLLFPQSIGLVEAAGKPNISACDTFTV